MLFRSAMLAADVDLHADVLKVPHHGGDTSLDAFLAVSGAAVAIVSVGQPNDYGHPVASVLATIAATGNIEADGPVDLTATNGIATAGNITTTADNITLHSATTLTGSITLSTGTGAGDIVLESGVWIVTASQ